MGGEVDPINVEARYLNVQQDALRMIRERLATEIPADSKTTCVLIL